MACKTCHKQPTAGPSGGSAQHTKKFSHHDGQVSRHADAITASQHVSPHGHVVPEGHGAGGSVAPPTAASSELAQAVDAYYNRTAAKRFVDTANGNGD